MADPAPSPTRAVRGTSLGADAWRRLRRNRLAIAGVVVLVLMTTACFLGPEILVESFGLRAEPEAKNAYRAPCAEHLFGTDEIGRDYLVRVLQGGRTSILVGIVATIVSVLIGVVYGALAGYYGGKLDEVLMRTVDFLYGLPYMFLVILVMLLFSDAERQSAIPIFVALGMVQWLPMARIVRGQVLTLRHQEYVQAARVLGAGDLRIIFRHILPNTLGVVIIYASLTVPAIIILESFLSYLGLGVQNSWGRLVSNGVKVVNPIESYWWLLLFPSLCLGLTLFSLNFLGDGLRDALDPRTRKR